MFILRSMHQYLNVWTTRFENLLVFIASILLAVLTFIITMGVIGRYFFNSPFAWTVEFSEYILLYVTFFSASCVLRQAGHVNIEIFVEIIPEKVKKNLYIFTTSLSLLASIMLTRYAFSIILDNYFRGLVMYKMIHMPKYILFLPIAIGFILISCRLFILLLDGVSNTYKSK